MSRGLRFHLELAPRGERGVTSVTECGFFVPSVLCSPRREDVTCGLCKRTRAYKRPLATEAQTVSEPAGEGT